MHGKITYYSSKNGLGAIINQFKRLFEFSKTNWHDTRTLPTTGMLVVFRVDENDNTVSDVKASRYQSFEDTPYLQEQDFWKTDDDEALQELEEKRKTEIINQRASKLDISKIKVIKENRSIERCVQECFKIPLVLAQENEEFLNKYPSKDELKYSLMKRFIEKALNQLYYIDKRIKPDNFDTYKQRLLELDHMVQELEKSEGKTDELFKQFYLKYQIEYHAIQFRLTSDKERLFQLKSKSKNLRSQIIMLNSKPKTERSSRQLKEKGSERQQIENDLGKLGGSTEKMTTMVDDFIKSKQSGFQDSYQNIRSQLIKQLHYLVDHLAGQLDTKMWELASKSEGVKNTFYKEGVESPYCSMTFLRVYTKRLKVELLKHEDQLIYEYQKRYDYQYGKNIILITESSNIAKPLRNYLFGLDKNLTVSIIMRPVEFYTKAKEISAEIVLIDSAIRSMSAHELAVKGRQIYRSTKTKFIVFQAN